MTRGIRPGRWVHPPRLAALGPSFQIQPKEEVLGRRIAALFHSLTESAQLTGVEPRAHLNEVARRTVRNSGSVTLARDLE